MTPRGFVELKSSCLLGTPGMSYNKQQGMAYKGLGRGTARQNTREPWRSLDRCGPGTVARGRQAQLGWTLAWRYPRRQAGLPVLRAADDLPPPQRRLDPRPLAVQQIFSVSDS